MERSIPAATPDTGQSQKYKLINSLLLVILLGGIIGNQIMLDKMARLMGGKPMFGNTFSSAWFKNSKIKLNGNLADDLPALVIHHGVPMIYGPEMNVNYDEVENAMDIMKQYDPDYGRQAIKLTDEEKKRYLEIALRISCEYCCGAASIIFPDGRAACGCAHSQAMRGLATYLLRNHPTELTNDQILRELAIWKGRYFPKQMMQKLGEQIQSGNYTPDIAALISGLKMPKYEGTAGEIPTSATDLPAMVGGC